MKTKIKTNSTILFLTSIISFFWLVIIMFQINTNLAEALNIDRLKPGILDFAIGSGHLFVLVFHVYAIIYIFIHFHHFKELRILKTAFLVLGIISLFLMGVEKVMVDEIAREYRVGMEISEIHILNSAYIINLIFSVCIFFLILKTRPLLKNLNPDTH